MWKQYNRLFAQHLAALLAAGVPEDQAQQRARQQARVEIAEKINQQRKVTL